MSDGRTRGWFTLYVVAFVLLLAAGAFVALSAKDFLSSLTPLYAAIGLCATSIVLAVLAVVLPKRTG